MIERLRKLSATSSVPTLMVILPLLINISFAGSGSTTTYAVWEGAPESYFSIRVPKILEIDAAVKKGKIKNYDTFLRLP